MSNALALGTVMGVLRARVRSIVTTANLNVDVVTGQPGRNADPGVYLTLYQLLPHPALRNFDLPTRTPVGVPQTQPVFALSLRILFSFVGDPATQEPERLAGLVLSDLHARPILGADEIKNFVATLPAGSPLAGADLADQAEKVRLSPVGLDTEEMSRIWGLFDDPPFALSMAWEASAVLLEAAVTPPAGRPVTDVGLAAEAVVPPRLTRLYAASTRQPVLERTDTLVIEGSGLFTDRSTLAVGKTFRALAPDDVVDGTIRIALNSLPNLVAGVQSVTITHRVVLPNGSERAGAVSNALGLMVRPVIDNIAVSGAAPSRTLTLTTTPVVKAEQGAELLLDDGTQRHVSRTFTSANNQIAFTFPAVPAGTYRAQLTVDGAANMPTKTGDVFSGPSVTLP